MQLTLLSTFITTGSYETTLPAAADGGPFPALTPDT